MHRTCRCLGTDSIITGIDFASGYQRVVGVLDIDSVVVRRVKIAVNRNAVDHRVVTSNKMQTTIVIFRTGKR